MMFAIHPPRIDLIKKFLLSLLMLGLGLQVLLLHLDNLLVEQLQCLRVVVPRSQVIIDALHHCEVDATLI
jgi:hypothetical protein